MCRDFASETIADTPPDMQAYLDELALQGAYRDGALEPAPVTDMSRNPDEMIGRMAILETAQALPNSGARTYYMSALRATANRNAKVKTK
jgi:hypothetical protein